MVRGVEVVIVGCDVGRMLACIIDDGGRCRVR